MNLKELEKLMKLCHKYNVKNITVDGVSIAIEAHIAPKQKTKITEQTAASEEPQYTDEDILMWSAGNGI
jgi:hypothetical protein